MQWMIPLLLAAALPMKAQTPAPVLSKVAQVLALPEEEAGLGTMPVHVRGVVLDISADRTEFSLHDGEGCVSVQVADGESVPDLGMQVEVEGKVFSEPFLERKRTRIRADKLALQGAGTLPEGIPSGIKEVSEFKHLDQWMSVEGIVLQVRRSMSLFTIQMVSDAASCNVLVRDWPRDDIPRDWIGGRVRVTGVNRAYLPGSSFLCMVVPSPAQVSVLKTGVSDPFDAPPVTVSALRKLNPASAERVKLAGTLVGATSGNVYYVRGDDGGAFSFYMLHPIDEDKSGRFSTPIIMAQCKPGDVVEVVGIPTLE